MRLLTQVYVCILQLCLFNALQYTYSMASENIEALSKDDKEPCKRKQVEEIQTWMVLTQTIGHWQILLPNSLKKFGLMTHTV